MPLPDEELYAMRDVVRRLDACIFGNGKPSLEEKLKAYIDGRDEHKYRNTQQDILDMRHTLDEKDKRDEKRSDAAAKAQFDTSRLVYIGMGIMIALEAIGIFKR